MPRLYLELLECRKKVRPELRNKEYVPKDITSALGPSLLEAQKISVTETFRLDDEKGQVEGPGLLGSKTATTKGREEGSYRHHRSVQDVSTRHFAHG